MSSRRSLRVAEQIQQEISRLLLFESKDSRLSEVTVTGVKMTPDLRIARIYYVAMRQDANRDVISKALSKAQGFLRRELSQRIRLRHSPELEFRYDASLETGRSMDAILHGLREQGQMGEADSPDTPTDVGKEE